MSADATTGRRTEWARCRGLQVADSKLQAGDSISVSFFPLKGGHPGGLLDSVTLPDGTVKKG